MSRTVECVSRTNDFFGQDKSYVHACQGLQHYYFWSTFNVDMIPRVSIDGYFYILVKMSLTLTNCDNCKGSGKVKVYLHYEGFEYITYEPCKLCQ